MDRQILNRYSRIPVDNSPSHQVPVPLRAPSLDIRAIEDSEPTHIVRPIQHVFAPLTYFLGWCISMMLLSTYFILYSSIRNPHFFSMWALAFFSQWVLHSLVIWVKKQSMVKPRIFSNSSLTSQLTFVGLIDFGITSAIFGILYTLWHV